LFVARVSKGNQYFIQSKLFSNEFLLFFNETLANLYHIGYTIAVRQILQGGYPDMAQITKDTIIGDILDIAPNTAPIFLSIGMHCLGCPSSRGETVEQACMVHGVDVDALLNELNSSIA